MSGVSVKIFESVTENDLSLPDEYKFDRSAGVISPRSDFVISRESDGRILSYYHDDVWDLSPYHSGLESKKLLFENIEDEGDRGVVKRLMFLLMLFGNGRSGTILSSSTLYDYFQGTLVSLSKYAQETNVSIKDVLEDSDKLETYARGLVANRLARAPSLNALMAFLSSLDSKNSGINFRANPKLIKLLHQTFSREYVIEQTPVIPASIFLGGARSRWEHFRMVEKNIDSLTKFISLTMSNPFYARPPKGKATVGGKSVCFGKNTNGYVSWENAVKENSLNTLFEFYSVRTRIDLVSFLSQFYSTCRHLILTYTGMRRGEAQLLQSDCLFESKIGKTTHVIGITTKISGVPQKMNWVTVSEIKKVVRVLVQIGDVIASERSPLVKERPLFVNLDLMKRTNKEYEKKDSQKSITASMRDSAELPLDEDAVCIAEHHIRELEDIAPAKNWRDDPIFQVGKPWRFKFHQYRRSLAVYAMNSGVVSISAMQTQFGHLFKEMTAYYGNGFGSAKSLVGTDASQHVKSKIKQLRPMFDFLAYAKNVLFSQEPLYGAHGVFVQKNETSMKDYILVNRKETMEKLKNGLLSYKETALGGCTTVEPCDSHLMGSIVNCIGCEGAAIKKSKLTKTVRQQRSLVDSLGKESLEYRTESRDLKILEDYLEIIKRKEDGKETA